MNCTVQLFNVKELSMIKELWECLNTIHFEDSVYFKDHYRENTFEKRCKKFYEIDPEDFRGYVVIDDESSVLGYCISTVNQSDRKGELDSIYLKDELRGLGLGSELVHKSVNWMKEKGCISICLSVADGHESVFEFYKKQGFYPRLTYMELKED